MFKHHRLSCAVLLLTASAPALAQDARPSPDATDVIQDPMARSRAPAPAQDGSAAPAVRKAHKEEPSFVFSFNPAMLLFGTIGVEFEGAVTPAASLFVAPAYIFGLPLFTPATGVSLSGFGVDVGLRYFPGHQAPKGFWIGPYAGFARATASTGDVEATATAIGGGGMLGYSWVPGGSFYVSIGVGGVYQAALLDTNARGSSNTADSSGPGLKLRLALGFAQ